MYLIQLYLVTMETFVFKEVAVCHQVWSTPQMKTITIAHRIDVKWSMVLQKK